MYNVKVVRTYKTTFCFFEEVLHTYENESWTFETDYKGITAADFKECLTGDRGLIFGTLPDGVLWYIDIDQEVPILLKPTILTSLPDSDPAVLITI